MLLRFASILITLAALIALILQIKPEKMLDQVLFAIGLISLISSIVLELIFYFKNRPKYYGTDEKIRNYMYKWITNGGKVTIFTRDLSWVADDSMRDLLRNKAHRNELCICLPERIPFVDELAKNGAQIYTYNELGYTPQSRFTIINTGRLDAQVAIGRKIKDKHLIEEFAIGESPVFAVTNDLAEIIKSYCAYKKK